MLLVHTHLSRLIMPLGIHHLACLEPRVSRMYMMIKQGEQYRRRMRLKSRAGDLQNWFPVVGNQLWCYVGVWLWTEVTRIGTWLVVIWRRPGQRCRTDWRTTVLHQCIRPVEIRHRLADHQQVIGPTQTKCTQLYDKQGEVKWNWRAIQTRSLRTRSQARTY